MANYLLSHYKGMYRIKTEYDQSTNSFPRQLNGNFEDIDCYIDCYFNIKIFSYGHGILEAYIPSKMRGNNIIRGIKKDYPDRFSDNFSNNKNKKRDIIFDLRDTDEEVYFKFHANDIDIIFNYIKPKTSGANISPFSSKNLPKSDYKIPDEDLLAYKNIIENEGKNQYLKIGYITKNYLKILAKKKKDYEALKEDMTLKCMKNKEYIHSIGKWNDYLDYLKKNLQES